MKKLAPSSAFRFLALISAAITSFHSVAMEELTEAKVAGLFATKNRLIMLWSVDCPPCYQELAVLEKLLLNYPDLPITLISTDDDFDRYEEVEEQYKRLNGKALTTWVFASGKASPLRYAIDKTWSGVLPRSYLVKATGKVGHSGMLKEKDFRKIFQLPEGPA